MESLHDEASRYGIERPELERRERTGQYGETIIELTPESEQAWSEYLRKITLAKIALHSSENTQ